MSDIQADFRTVDLSDLPPIGTISDDRRKVLWVLMVGRDRASHITLRPNDVSIVLRDVYGIHMSRQRVQGILAAEKGTVARRKRREGLRYQLMQSGADEAMATGRSIVLIQPDQALSAIRTVESVLGSLRGVLRICDPYSDGATLDMLGVTVRASSIRLLTMEISRPGPFARDLAAFRKQYPMSIEVRAARDRVLHDRYVIDDSDMYLIGTSLNGIGKKQTFVVRAGEDVRAMAIGGFDAQWRVGRAL